MRLPSPINLSNHLFLTVSIVVIAALLTLISAPAARAFGPDPSHIRITAPPPAPGFNPTSKPKEVLGKQLFFDPVLSGGNTMSCASCHIPSFGWTDRQPRSPGETGVTRKRRTPSLQDVGWNRYFARDGRIETLEGFVLGPISHPDEMNQNLDLLVEELSNKPPYPDMFKRAFDQARPSLDAVSLSLATYLRSLRSSSSPFDRWAKGDADAMSLSAVEGYKLFLGKGRCNQCHQGWRFTDQKFHDIGLPTSDTGRAAIEPENPLALYAFKTPSLRNVTIRPPYMHDGSIASLEGVIAHYQGGIIRRPSLSRQLQPLDLTDQEKVNLIEFLKHLTDDKHLIKLKTALD